MSELLSDVLASLFFVGLCVPVGIWCLKDARRCYIKKTLEDGESGVVYRGRTAQIFAVVLFAFGLFLIFFGLSSGVSVFLD